MKGETTGKDHKRTMVLPVAAVAIFLRSCECFTVLSARQNRAIFPRALMTYGLLPSKPKNFLCKLSVLFGDASTWTLRGRDCVI